jgi:hypothetical protein
MAIISASRRTDIPTFFSEWFLNRLHEGNIMVRNPKRYDQVSDIKLSKDTIDCIVFWTKNPIPMLPRIEELNEMGYPYYFQFTLTRYGKDIEEGLPDKLMLIKAFQRLHDIGNGHIIWRYDPIVFTSKYTPEWHLKAFESIARRLEGYTDKCVISFVDTYDYNKKFLKDIKAKDISQLAPFGMGVKLSEFEAFCKALADIAHEYNMKVATCAEVVDLDKCGIEHNKCIDPDYIEKIIGKPIKNAKDSAQREACGCVESIEVGSYNTCMNGCKYCYACKDRDKTRAMFKRYDPDSPLLCDKLTGEEIITERKMKSMVDYKKLESKDQLSFF